MHDTLIKKVCSKVFNVKDIDVNILEQLKLGMSNYVYLVKVLNDKFTFRIPGNYADLFVNRRLEKKGIEVLKEIKLGPDTIYFDDDGVKISNFVEGRVLYNNIHENDYDNVAIVLHNLHAAKSNDLPSYNPFDLLDYYEKRISSALSESYYKIKSILIKHKDFLDKQEKVLCHNDAQPSNFVFGIDNKMYLLDYEFIGLNDPIYDIACFGNNNINDGEKLLKNYLKRTPNISEENRFYLWRTFQNVQWYLVALCKHELKMDEKLGLDFKMVSKMFLSQAENSILKVK